MKVLISALLAVAIVALMLKLARAPLYARYDANQCRQAYAAARSRTDTVAVDLHPFRTKSGPNNHRCGEVRAIIAITRGDIPGLR